MREKLAKLSQRITLLDSLYAMSKRPETYKERMSLQAEYDLIMSQFTTQLLLRSRSRFFEQGDKTSKLLAHRLRQISDSQLISRIDTGTRITSDPAEINNTFMEFYKLLYSSDFPDTPPDLRSFFDKIDTPTLDQNLAKDLERPVTTSELAEAVKSLQSGKSPGPDGFPADFYKLFWKQLAPHILEMFTESFYLGILPHTLNQASISLLLKKGKDPLQCGSYRPISLLNADFKLLSKVLARRLETALPTIISLDQTGFIRNRHSFSNLRGVFNVVYNPSSSSLPEALVALDAEKAFDRVEWEYLFFILGRFGFGEKFISWVRLLYASPLASVRTNGTNSEYFRLSRSTRQGCPLSPLLFALVMEPLSIALRSNPDIRGVSRFGVELKVALNADDLLLVLSDIAHSIPAALSVLDAFSKISGYKLNLNKSEIFPVNKEAKEYPLKQFPFKIAVSGFVYLGVYIADTLTNLHRKNFLSLLSQIQSDFERWSLLNLSVAARINTVKMNIFPRFLYLFQCIPIFLPLSFFRKLDTLLLNFIWNKKTPRLSRQVLQRPKASGGMALPNFLYYHWATTIRNLNYWVRCEDIEALPSWLSMEAASARPVSLKTLLYSPLQSSTSGYTKSVIVASCLKTWV